MYKNIIFITRCLGTSKEHSFVDLDKVDAVSLPNINGLFKIQFTSGEVWDIIEDDFEYTMQHWCANYKSITAYNNYIYERN